MIADFTVLQNYKESVLEPMLNGTEKVPQVIQEYKEYNTDTSVKFIVKMSSNKMKEAEAKGLHKFFSLQTSINVSNLLVRYNYVVSNYCRLSDTTECLLVQNHCIVCTILDR